MSGACHYESQWAQAATSIIWFQITHLDMLNHVFSFVKMRTVPISPGCED
jgi:hypothetical protein